MRYPITNTAHPLAPDQETLVVVHAFNLCIGKQKQEGLCEFRMSLAYGVSFMTVSATHTISASKKERKRGKWEKKNME